LLVKPEKWEEHLNWIWHWKRLKNKIINEYQQKMLVAKKKKNIKLKEEKDRKLKELLDKYGLDYLV
jgi:hypothetical protein